jgi:NADH-quinone oxidoreductase subunit N
MTGLVGLDLAIATAPELAMAALGLFVLLFDVVALRGAEPSSRAATLGGITAAGLGGVAVFMWSRMGSGDQGLGDTLAIVCVLLSLGTAMISISYRFTKHVGEYFALLILSTIGMSFLVKTDNLITFFVALELLSVCLYVLTAFHKGVQRSAESALKYFLFGATSSAFLLFGLSWLVGSTGAVDLRALSSALQNPSALAVAGLLFILVGLGFKVAVAPFHLWAPDAYEGAPTPVAALIATGSKVASFTITAKLMLIGFASFSGRAMITQDGASFAAGWIFLFAVLSAASMIWGNFAALAQTNIKRMLAYSSVAHAGYILVALVAADKAGVTAVLFYLVVYGLANLGAFGVVSALTEGAGGDDLEDFDGMAQRSPLMSMLLLLFVLSLAGIPPLAGFFGKFMLFGAAFHADTRGFGLMWLVVIALVTSAVSLYYYLILMKRVFIHAPRSAAPVSVARCAKWTLSITALAVLVLGVWPQPLLTHIASLLQWP